MKVALILSLMILAPSGHAVSAAQLQPYSDIDVISVAPKNPATKPFVMAVFTIEQQRRLNAAASKRPTTRNFSLARQ